MVIEFTPVVIHCIDYLMGISRCFAVQQELLQQKMVSIIHASYHNVKVNIIMANKTIEIDTAKADTTILMMHKNI